MYITMYNNISRFYQPNQFNYLTFLVAIFILTFNYFIQLSCNQYLKYLVTFYFILVYVWLELALGIFFPSDLYMHKISQLQINVYIN